MSEVKERLKENLLAAALGDEQAIENLAEYLDTTQPDNTAVANVEKWHQDRWDMRNKVDFLKRDHPYLDATLDPDGFLAAQAFDTQLATRYPNMSVDDRLARVVKKMDKDMGSPETRDYSSAINDIVGRKRAIRSEATENQLRLRAAARVSAAERAADEEHLFGAQSAPDELDEIRTEAIEDLVRSRQLRAGPEMSAEQKKRLYLDQQRREQQRREREGG
jgi:hypothetical protein